MTQLSFKLEVFEGPLDLMLSLISKHKLDIADIEISLLLEQFLAYLDEMNEAKIQVAAEFLEMAARLIYIKSAALLPKEEVEQLKKELEGVLIEYALCKKISAWLKTQYVGSDIFTREPLAIEMDKSYRLSHNSDVLASAYLGISKRNRHINETTPQTVAPIVPKSYISVFSKVVFVLKALNKNETIETDALYKGLNRSEQVATFLALLELVKSERIMFSPDGGTIHFAKPKSTI